MEKVEKICKPLEKYAEKVPQLIDLSKKAGVSSGILLAGLLLVGGVFVFIFFGATILTLSFTVLYPSIQSIKAIESKGEDDDKEWLTYWTIFGVFSLIDDFGGFLLQFIPYYSWFKLALLVYLMAPQTKGAMTLYTYLVSPVLKQHKDKIQAFIDEIKGSAAEAAQAAKDKAKQEMSNPANLVKASNLYNEAQEQMKNLE